MEVFDWRHNRRAPGAILARKTPIDLPSASKTSCEFLERTKPLWPSTVARDFGAALLDELQRQE
jgi:hypothetical protein